MISLDPLRPYATAIKWGIIAALALGLFGSGMFTGCSVQQNRSAAKIAELERKIVERDRALVTAATALRQASATLRGISATTRANEIESKRIQQAGAKTAAQAERDAKSSARRLALLEQLLQDERTNCTEGRMQICGTPLR